METKTLQHSYTHFNNGGIRLDVDQQTSDKGNTQLFLTLGMSNMGMEGKFSIPLFPSMAETLRRIAHLVEHAQEPNYLTPLNTRIETTHVATTQTEEYFTKEGPTTQEEIYGSNTGEADPEPSIVKEDGYYKIS